MRIVATLLVVALAAASFAALGQAQDTQSLAEMAAEAKRKKQESTRPVLTNDELSGPGVVRAAAPGWPSIGVLPGSPDPPTLAPFLPTPLRIVEAMLELAGVRADDVVFDIGSGDGRIVIAAAELFGARGVGIEIDPNLVWRSRKAIQDKGLADRVQIIHANALDVDLSSADVVTLFLTPSGNEILRPHLEESLRRGIPVVSRDFPIVGWELVEEREVMRATLYLYRVP